MQHADPDAPPRRVFAPNDARARWPDLFARLVPALDRSDPFADAAVAALDAMSAEVRDACIEAAVRRGPSAPGLPQPLAALLDEVFVPLTDVQRARFAKAGDVLHRTGPFGGIALGVKSLVSGYAAPAGNKPLVFSGRLEHAAARRLNETARFVREVTTPGGLEPGADGFAMSVRVRLVHARVRSLVRRTGRWDDDAWSLPINQHDQVATTLLFSSVLLEGLERLGMRFTCDERDDYVALWSHVGWLMGTERPLLPTCDAEARQMQHFIEATQAPPDDDSRRLTAALLAGPPPANGDRLARARSAVLQPLAASLCRGMLGDPIADGLGVPPASRAIWHATQLAAVASDRAQRLVPGGRRRAVAAGRAYWDRVVAVGLTEATAHPRLPDRLSGRAVPGRRTSRPRVAEQRPIV